MEWWQHIPIHLHPIAFLVGIFPIRYYALAWLAGFFSVLFVALRLTRKTGYGTKEDVNDLFLVLFFGALIGGHVGYAFLYTPFLFFSDPSLFFLPYDSTNGTWTGVSGMSFHSGLIGVVLGLYFFTKRKQWDFFQYADVVALVAPVALFFGRLGNFLNQELYGRVTSVPWGMYFPEDSMVLRHPSSLYEAGLEGIVLFFFLWYIRPKVKFRGGVAAIFLVGYGVLRFIGEFFREPDAGLSLTLNLFTRGQLLSVLMALCGGGLFFWRARKNRDTIGL